MRTAHNGVLPSPTPAVIPPRYPLPVPKGCVLLYDMLGGGHVKQLDHSPYHCDGTLTGTTQTATGRYFDGNDSIAATISAAPPVYTVEIVFSPGVVNVEQHLAEFAQNQFFIVGASNKLLFNDGSSITGGTALSAGKWYHAAAIRGVTSKRLVLGRNYDANAVAIGATVPTSNFFVGRIYSAPANFLTGNVGYLMVHDREVGLAELASNYDYLKAVMAARGVNLQ